MRRLLHTWSRLREIRRGEDPAGQRKRDRGQIPKVSVMVVTFNHERYIAEALDSILMQERDFDIEINVIDDASTDGTQEIVRGYHARYPKIVNCYFNETNVGHVATQLNTYRGFQTLKGEYFALLEGDDYWTDPTKLRTQVKFLDSHREYVACGHDTLKVYEGGDRPAEHFLPFKEFGRQRAGIGDLIGLAAVFHLSSLVYRNVFEERPPLCLADPYSCETTINMVYGQFGDFYHMSGYMSVYRAHEGGVFSTRSQESIWLFHLYGFDRFALYLGWRNAYWFVRAIAGFSAYVLTAHKQDRGPRLRLMTRALFLAHLLISRPAFLVMHYARRERERIKDVVRVFSDWKEEKPRTSIVGLTYNVLVAATPQSVLRLVVRAEERWPILRRIRFRMKDAARGSHSSGAN